jgi:glycerol-3-phosphate acyltransferase PlsY
MPWIITGIIVSYLLGSIPTAYIFGRLLKGIDIRRHGSGNVGATNAIRVLGKGPGIVVLLLDALKGFVSVVLVGGVVAGKAPLPAEITRIILGMVCIFGHNWTVFLNFKGGKGMATSLGVLIGLSLQINGLRIVLGLAIVIWLLVFLIFRIVSLASMISALALPILCIFLKSSHPLIFTSCILSFFVLLRHKSNLKRLLQGKEKPLF